MVSRAGHRFTVPVSWTVDPAPPPAQPPPTQPPPAQPAPAQPAGDAGAGLGSTVAALLPPLLGALALGLRRLLRARSRRRTVESQPVDPERPERVLEGVS